MFIENIPEIYVANASFLFLSFRFITTRHMIAMLFWKNRMMFDIVNVIVEV